MKADLASVDDTQRLASLGARTVLRGSPSEPPDANRLELDPRALHGLVGDYVRALRPHTESDPAAILIQLLVAFGSMINRGPHWRIGATRHSLNLFAVLVGETAVGRKGTAWNEVLALCRSADENWTERCIGKGFQSGEGLIWSIRDPVERLGDDGESVAVDPGVTDKRLTIVQSEFCSILKIANRQGSTLSDVVRDAFDSGDLRAMSKNSPARATGGHVSIIGHITPDELRRQLTATEIANGFANRFMWLLVRRPHLLPEGGTFTEDDRRPFGARLRDAVQYARGLGDRELRRAPDIRAQWASAYAELEADRPGMLGAITSRGAAQVMRLACLYALLDGTDLVREEHLEAAVAVWRYSFRSCRRIFGPSLGDPIADRIVAELRRLPQGLRRTEISVLLGRNVAAERLESALRAAETAGQVTRQREPPEGGPGRGRPAERFFATKETN